MSHRIRASLSLAASATVCGILVVVACSDPSGQGNGCQSTGADVIINAQDNLSFDKLNLTITRGQKVCWQNAGSVTHNVTSDPAVPADSNWALDAQLSTITVVLYTFGRAGDYPYHCFFHAGSNMRGTIHVP